MAYLPKGKIPKVLRNWRRMTLDQLFKAFKSCSAEFRKEYFSCWAGEAGLKWVLEDMEIVTLLEKLKNMPANQIPKKFEGWEKASNHDRKRMFARCRKGFKKMILA
jgi:hypothetical protein